MGIASNMKELTQDIASSRQDRAKRIGEIKKETGQLKGETKDLLNGFQASRKELKAEINEASASWQGLGAKKTKNKVRGTKKWESQKE
jgi:cell division septum initiation protein DivIVA